MPFAQLILGSPGAGKSTYCDGSQYFTSFPGSHELTRYFKCTNLWELSVVLALS